MLFENQTTKSKIIQYLNELALKYLSRYSTSSISLAKYLEKKAKSFYKNELLDNEQFLNEIKSALEETIEYMLKLGYLNDDLYTKYKTKSLVTKGKSTLNIKNSLYEKGLSKSNINNYVNEDNSYYINLSSAIKTVKKKKFGPYRNNNKNLKIPEDEYELHNLESKNFLHKEITSLLRYGFPYDIIKKVLNSSQEELENQYDNLKNKIDI